MKHGAKLQAAVRLGSWFARVLPPHTWEHSTSAHQCLCCVGSARCWLLLAWQQRHTQAPWRQLWKGPQALSKLIKQVTCCHTPAPAAACRSVNMHDAVERDMKGRITVFSISGCPHCRAAKSLLKSKGAPFVEINLDAYPERRAEMEAVAKKSSAPQILFNDVLIGGNDSLQALNEKGELDNMLTQVYNTPVPPGAPAPPPPPDESGKTTSRSKEFKTDEHEELMGVLRSKLIAQGHARLFQKSQSYTFKGSELVDFLVKHQQLSRKQAITLGSILVQKRYILCISRKQIFRDSESTRYCFLENDPSIKERRCLNFSGTPCTLEPQPATEVGDRLRRTVLAIYDDYLSEDGRKVDYPGIAKAESFKSYIEQTEQLQRLDLTSLDRNEKVAFFINIYNAMVIHVTTVLGQGASNAAERAKFFGHYTYIIGGFLFSLSEIENGVLRGNRRPPYAFARPFCKNDPRAEIALPAAEPLVHFALVCGAKSCPPVKTYKAAGLEDQLNSAAKSFFESGGLAFEAKNQISLSKILYWYHIDFGKTDAAMLDWIAQFLEGEQKNELHKRRRQGVKITYQTYDWSANSH